MAYLPSWQLAGKSGWLTGHSGCSSTCGTLAYTNRIRRPLWMSFSALSRHLIMTLLPPATSYANLRQHEGWHRSSAASDDAWNRYQDALQSELHMWYGAKIDLTAWHTLCCAISVEPLPKTWAMRGGKRLRNESWSIYTDVDHRLYEGHTLTLSIWLNRDEVTVRKKFRPSAMWQSCEPTPRRLHII
jgi:hypothetical protein